MILDTEFPILQSALIHLCLCESFTRSWICWIKKEVGMIKIFYFIIFFFLSQKNISLMKRFVRTFDSMWHNVLLLIDKFKFK